MEYFYRDIFGSGIFIGLDILCLINHMRIENINSLNYVWSFVYKTSKTFKNRVET